MKKKEDLTIDVKNVELKPNWIRHVDTRFNVLHVLRSKGDLYKLLNNIEEYYKDILVTIPEYVNGKQSDDGKEFDNSHYDRYSREFTDWHVGHANGIMNRTRCKSVLDVGCGIGSMVRGFLKNGVNIHGIDISKYAVENCDKEISEKVLNGDIRKIDTLPKMKFDLVTCYNVLEHVQSPDIAIYNMSNLSDRWIHITVRDIRYLYPEDVKIFDPTLITGRGIKWYIDEFEKDGFEITFDLDYTWLIFEPRYALVYDGCPILQALFRKKENII